MNLQFTVSFRLKYAIPVLALLVTLLTSTSHSFAQSSSHHHVSPSAHQNSFRCFPTPHIQAPPAPMGATRHSALKAICPSGQVPQPTTAPAIIAKSKKGAPPADGTLHPSIAPGYHYVHGYQHTTGIGAEGYLSQHKPFLNSSDNHTLAEIAGQSSDGKQIAEIGWTVDRGLNGDDNPHLFVFAWCHGVGNCYNGCGYVQFSSTLPPGMTVASDGSQHLYAMEYFNGNWWLYYDTEWIGYFPGSIWSNKGVTFTQVGLIQWFGEVLSKGGSNTQMGNGILGSNPGSASISNAAVITTPSSAAHASINLNATDPSCYNYGWITLSYSFRYGGPGC